MAIEKTLRGIVILGIFALPFIVFIVANNLFFPYITGKNFAFRIIVEIITGAWLALALVKPEYRPRKSWILGIFAAFTIIVALADTFGVNPFKSFWSNYERMDGWVTLAHLLLYFVVASSIFNTEKLWRKFWLFSLGISSLVALHGLLQMFGIVSVDAGFSSTSRISATFGNPIYLAGYMLFHIFIASILMVQSGNDRWNTLERFFGMGFLAVFSALLAILARDAGWIPYLVLVLFGALAVWLLYAKQKYLLVLLLAIDTAVLFLTGTRGAMLGLIGGVLLSALLIAILGKDSPRAKKWAAGSVAAILVLAGAFWLVRDQAWVNKVPFLQRLATISLQDNTTKARFMNWGMAWQGVKERPILGWGQENYAIVFDKYYNPQMYAQEQWFDRVHNIVFDWLVAAGFLGLFGYLGIFFFALLYVWRTPSDSYSQVSQKKREHGEPFFGILEKSLLTGLLAAYFFHNLFVFDNITSYLLFTTVLAYIASRATTARNASFILPSRQFSYKSIPIIAATAVIVVWGVGWAVNGKALAQNRALINAISPQEEGITKNLEYFKEAIDTLGMGSQEASEQVAQAAVLIGPNENVTNEMKMQFVELAKKGLGKQAELSPLDARSPLFLGALLGAYGNHDEAAKALEKALELSPTKQTILFEIAQNAIARGDGDAALKAYKQAFELAPEFDTARIYYATFLIQTQQDKLADEILAPIIKSGTAADPRIAGAYASRGRYDKIVTIWKAHIAARPENIQARFTLAAALYASGKSTEAIAILEEAARLDPNSKAQVDSLIQEIRSGTAKI
ncbi:MAG TPA: O-antigen ligase family protein [Candidatus Paceibacterota bacterium]